MPWRGSGVQHHCAGARQPPSKLLRALAVAGRTRSVLLPDVPTVGESGLPGFEATVRYGLLAPIGTPRPIIDRINSELLPPLAPAVRGRPLPLRVESRRSVPQFQVVAGRRTVSQEGATHQEHRAGSHNASHGSSRFESIRSHSAELSSCTRVIHIWPRGRTLRKAALSRSHPRAPN
jgi:Tripartite tricarboxylate transporter family receptor